MINKRGPGRPRKSEGLKKVFSISLNENMSQRMESYLDSPLAVVKSRNELIETSVSEFLDREEPINEELEKARIRIEKKMKRQKA